MPRYWNPQRFALLRVEYTSCIAANIDCARQVGFGPYCYRENTIRLRYFRQPSESWRIVPMMKHWPASNPDAVLHARLRFAQALMCAGHVPLRDLGFA